MYVRDMDGEGGRDDDRERERARHAAVHYRPCSTHESTQAPPPYVRPISWVFRWSQGRGRGALVLETQVRASEAIEDLDSGFRSEAESSALRV